MKIFFSKIKFFAVAAFGICTACLFGAQPVLAAGWVTMPSGTTNAFYGFGMSTDGVVGIAAGGGGALKWTSDGGKTWNNSTAAGSTTMRAVAFAPSSRVAWVVGAAGKILKTENGGATFDDKTSLASGVVGGVALYGAFALNDNIMWAVGSGGKIVKTYNGGSSWFLEDPLTTNTIRNIFFLDENTGWAVADGGVIVKTVNGGSSWSGQISGTGEALKSVNFLNYLTGYVVGDNRTLLKTTDGGSNWFPLTVTAVPSGTAFNSVHFFNATYGLIGGADGKIVETSDGANSWSALSTGTTNSIYRVLYGGISNKKYAAGLNGTILKYDAGNPTPPTGLALAEGGNITSDTTPSVVWIASSDNETSVVDYLYQVCASISFCPDSGSIGSAATNHTFSVGFVGPVTIKIAAKDAAGNTSDYATIDFTLDTTPPTVGVPSPATATVGQSMTISATYSDTQTAVTACSLWVDTINMGSMTLDGGTATKTHSFSSSGSHNVQVLCTDEAGNDGMSAVTAVNVSAAAPDTTPSAATSLVSASPSSVVADNTSISTITVTVKNAASTALSGKLVTLTSSRPTSDTITAISQTTNSSGQATFSVKSSAAGASMITVLADSVTLGTANVTFTSVSTPPDTAPSASTSLISASPSSVTADNASLSTITVTVKNAAATALSGKLVTLTSSRPTSDTITAISQTTNSSGQATFSVKSNTAGSSTFTSSADGITLASAVVTFTAVSTPTVTTPSASYTSVSASPSSVVADNASTAMITVTVKNSSASVLSGKSVSLSSSRPAFDTISAVAPTTNSFGQAIFNARSSVAGTSSFIATVDGMMMGYASVYFSAPTVTPPPVPTDTVVSASKSLVIAAPKKVRADGIRTGKVVVVARNASGQVLSGKTVTLGSSFSSVSMNQTQAVTNAYGIAKFVVYSGTPGLAQFTATADGAVLDKKPSITFISTPTTACSYPVVPVGSLVKLPDDSNPATQEDTAVYFYGKDCKRHAFPNSKMYFTWYQNFNDVITVAPEVLASMPLGSNVRYRPAIKMVKFTTVSKVYAIGLNGELRWVKSEAVATALYGPQWNKNIDDLSDAFYTNYTFGSDIEDGAEFQVDAESDNAQTIDDDL
ncbi:MAG: invasin domain 3-containing protein [Patescibacteria group bacterium]